MLVNEFPWDPRYAVSGLDNVLTPALVIYPEIIASNIERTVHLLGGDADRWRVHIKTSKLAYTLRLLVERGVLNFKCATTLELLVACQCGARDILLAYPTMGANVRRVREIANEFSDVHISVLIENEEQLRQWRGSRVGIFLDLNSGMNRTGIDEGHPDDVVDAGTRNWQRRPGVPRSALLRRTIRRIGRARTDESRARWLRSPDENCGRSRAQRNKGSGVNHRRNADVPERGFLSGFSQCKFHPPGFPWNGCVLRRDDDGATAQGVRLSTRSSGADARSQPSPRRNCYVRRGTQGRIRGCRRPDLRGRRTPGTHPAFSQRRASSDRGERRRN